MRITSLLALLGFVVAQKASPAAPNALPSWQTATRFRTAADSPTASSSLSATDSPTAAAPPIATTLPKPAPSPAAAALPNADLSTEAAPTTEAAPPTAADLPTAADPPTATAPPNAADPPKSTAPPTEAIADDAARARRAGDLLRQGKASEAADLYAAIVAGAPEDAPSMAGRVRALIAAGQWRRALEEARRFSANAPTSQEVQVSLGEALYRAGLLMEARPLLERLEKADSASPRALLFLGLLRVAEGYDEDGAKLMDRAFGLSPDDRDILFWSSGAASSRARAIDLLERYLKLSEGDDEDRIEGAKGTIRLYKALGERRVWVPNERPEHLELPLWSLRDREGRATGFVTELSTGQIDHAKPLRVLLDSGSGGLFLLERMATPAGFTLLSEETVFAGGGKGRQPSKRGLMPTVALGQLSFRDALVSTTTTEIEPTGRYHGVLGLSVFEGYRITLDLARDRLILDRLAGPGIPPEGSPAPVMPSTAAVPIPLASSSTAPASGSAYWTVSGQILVEAAASNGKTGLFLFDTGATNSLLSLDLVEGGGATRTPGDATVRGYGGRLPDARIVHGIRVRFQGLENPEPVLNAADLSQRSRLGGVEISGFLGLDVLHRARITVDTESRRILVTRPAHR